MLRKLLRRNSTRNGTAVRCLSRSEHEHEYIDEWLASIVKPESFYETYAAPTRKQKCYFYNIDLQGRVFLEETFPKNLTSCIKNTAFLDFFYKRLQPVGPKHAAVLNDDVSLVEEYPFVSPCGIELNFVRPADSPIVFHGLDGTELVFAGTLKQPFDPLRLAISAKTGHLYHELSNSETSTRERETAPPSFGLIRSSVAVTLSECIVPMTNDNTSSETKYGSGMMYLDEQVTCTNPREIQWLPEEAEPGLWAMRL